MTDFENISYRVDKHIAVITVARERKLNALNRQTIAELETALQLLAADEAVWGAIITGAGEKAFVAGADISEFVGLSIAEAQLLSKKGHHVFTDLIEQCPKPIIAAINGFALGGGLELAMACHIRLAVPHACLGLPEVSLGIIPGYGGTQRLPLLVGKGRAMQMILTGDMINADTAFRIGLINEIIETGQLIARAEAILHAIFTRSGTAVSAAITAVNAAEDPLQDGFGIEVNCFSQQFGTRDYVEGVAAFLEKRKPEFR